MIISRISCVAAVAVLAGAAAAQQAVLPTLPHAASNVAPFGRLDTTHHQVYNADLFRNLGGGAPVTIESIAFSYTSAFSAGESWQQRISISMGYTDKVPGEPAPIGLELPSTGNNPKGPMTAFFQDPAYAFEPTVSGPDTWELVFDGTPFEYHPAEGNLLIEIFTDGTPSTGGRNLGVSRAGGSPESSRAYEGQSTVVSPTTALRTLFTYSVGTTCYPDCNNDGVLDFFDFLCFQNAFLAQDPYADCNGDSYFDFFDFLCFQNEFLAGCP